jgi:hypothetical protein
MRQMRTPLRLSFCGAVAAAAILAGGLSVSAQTGNLTSSAAPAPKKRTTATPDMVNEAIQRSQARAAKAQQFGTPERFGSEEPFVYNPAQKNFSASQQ